MSIFNNMRRWHTCMRSSCHVHPLNCTSIVIVDNIAGYIAATGEIISSKASLAVLPVFAAEAARSTVFLWVTSFLPPTGVVNVAAAVIAVSITLAMLATINSILASGAKLEEEELLKSKFRTYQKQAETALKGLALTDVRDLPSMKGIIEKFL